MEIADEFPDAVGQRVSDERACGPLARCAKVVQKQTKEGVVRVVLKVWSSNPDCSAGCDYAIVEIGEEFSKLALRRINVLCEQKAVDPPVYETYCWDFSAQYFSPWTNRPTQPSEVQESDFDLEETLEDLEVDTREVVTAPADFRVLDSQIVAVECAQMIVREGSIAFNALLRHTDIYVTTAEIPKQVLESVLTTATA